MKIDILQLNAYSILHKRFENSLLVLQNPSRALVGRSEGAFELGETGKQGFMLNFSSLVQGLATSAILLR